MRNTAMQIKAAENKEDKLHIEFKGNDEICSSSSVAFSKALLLHTISVCKVVLWMLIFLWRFVAAICELYCILSCFIERLRIFGASFISWHAVRSPILVYNRYFFRILWVEKLR